MKFTKQKEYDKGYGWVNTYVCGNWSIVNIESGWMVSYKGKQVTITDTLKEGKANVCGMVAFNEELI